MNHLLEYYRIQKNTLFDKVASLQQQMDVEELHDLRVTLKRMRAFFRMLKKIEPGLYPSTEDYRRIKAFFKTAGKLRDIHVQEKEIAKHEKDLGIDLSFLQHYLKYFEETYEKQLKAALDQFDKELYNQYENFLQRELQKHVLYYTYKEVVSFTHDRLKEARKRIDKADTAENLHKVRSILKDVLYYLEIINSEEHVADISEKDVKDSQSFLGDWHDNVVTFDTVQEFKENNQQLAQKNTGTIEILEDYLIKKIHFN
jgi:CHAD domain-containing protein